MGKGARKAWGVVMGVGVLAAVVGLLLWRQRVHSAGEPTVEAPVTRPPSPPVASTPAPEKPRPPQDLLRPVPCELPALVEEYRRGKDSPAYRRYVREQLQGLVGRVAPEELWAKVEAERDAEVLEALAGLWVTHFNRSGERSVLERVVEKAGREEDAARRAALVRALRQSGEPASEVLARTPAAREAYRTWVKDAAPEVREAVVGNLVDEAARSFGRSRETAERRVSLAVEASAPETAAGLLGALSLESVRSPSVAQVLGLLEGSGHAGVRAAAARALGTVAAGEARRVMQALAGRYAAEPEPSVRKALLEGIARLGLSSAIPTLQKLKGVDAAMDAEVDLWLSLLASQPQTWNLLEQDKRALEHKRDTP
jgi:hypothetical protein